MDFKGCTDSHSIATSSSMAVGLQRGGHGENYFDLTIDDDDDTPVKKGSVTDDDRNCSG